MSTAKRECSFSVELFPPSTPVGWEKITEMVEPLEALGPQFVSVTFGAAGSKQSPTLTLVKQLTESSLTISPHMTGINMPSDMIDYLLAEYKNIGIKQLVVIRGDLTADAARPHQFSYANELVNYIRHKTGNYFKIIVAAYPEFHPESQDPTTDLFNFKRKINVGANAAITQYFFSPDAYYRYIENCAKFGITIPITPGIMPISDYTKLKRFSKKCQAEIPLWLDKRLQDYQDKPASLRQFGIDVITKLCEDLLSYGAPSLHFYTLNSLEPTTTIIKQLTLDTPHEMASISPR